MSTSYSPTHHTLDLPETVPVYSGSLGPAAFSAQSIKRQTEMLSFDPGFTATASCESKITFIDGEKGLLLHRGYPIEELAQKSNFTELAYLLLKGELPSQEQFTSFQNELSSQRLLNEQMRNFFNGFRRDTHPMAILCGTVAAISTFHPELTIHNIEDREKAAKLLIAKVPTIAAWAYKYTRGEPFIYPEEDLPFSENLLHMLFALPGRRYKVNPVLARAIDRILLLHADHEQNASTTAVRLVGSTGANPFACISAGIAALWGPAHGGANEAALDMFRQIGSRDNIPAFLEKVKNKEPGVRLMGFGHRIYKNFDPRSKLLRDTCYEVIETLGLERDPMLDLALELERIALEDDYFISRKLYPNVDFYSGLILKALGIPTSMFTALFAIARTSGWTSQWLEMTSAPNLKIMRPHQIYTGHTKRPVPDINNR